MHIAFFLKLETGSCVQFCPFRSSNFIVTREFERTLYMKSLEETNIKIHNCYYLSGDPFDVHINIEIFCVFSGAVSGS